jgi:dGTPase
MEAIAFSHDLGHPPFGHGGEVALNFAMRDSGGFEGNGQSLRILSKLESHDGEYGLDPTRRMLLGVLKYPIPYEIACRRNLAPVPASIQLVKTEDWKPPKCYMATEQSVVDWLLEPFAVEDRKQFLEIIQNPDSSKHSKARYKALDTSIMDVADDIAYGVHDLEDGIVLGLITGDHWGKIRDSLDRVWAHRFHLGNVASLQRRLFSDDASTRKRAVGALVNAFITSSQLTSISRFQDPLLAFNADVEQPARIFLKALKDLTATHIVGLQSVQTMEYRGRFVVMSLLEALSSDPTRLLTPIAAVDYQMAQHDDARQRVICDYVASMTDS